MTEVGDVARNALNVAAAAKLMRLAERASKISDDAMLTRTLALFETSVKASQRLARRELRQRHGDRIKMAGPAQLVGTPYFRSIMSDAIFNIFRISNLLKLGRTPEPLRRELRNRLMAGLTSAINRAYSQELSYQYAVLAPQFDFVLRKRWVSRLAPNTCVFCRAMHGQTVDINEAFTAPDGVRIYFDLLVPGLHPYCQCHIEIVVPTSTLLFPRRR